MGLNIHLKAPSPTRLSQDPFPRFIPFNGIDYISITKIHVELMKELFRMLLGAHVSTAGGVHFAPINGKALGCTAIQIFSKNQRQWAAKPLSAEEIKLFAENLSATDIESVVAHDSYLINMASPDIAMRKKSIAAFIDEIERANALQLNGIVFHPGSHLGKGISEGIRLLCDSLNEATEKTAKSRVRLLIETTAGQGSNLGNSFEQIRDMLAGLKESKRFGVCVDTCHLFGAGYSITTADDYTQAFAAFEKTIGVSRIECFHVNDSKQPFDSRKDRHDNIGEGLMGLEGFRLLMNDSRFDKIPKILETPGGDEAYAKDLALLRSLTAKKGK